MLINNDFINQWEPIVQKISSTKFIKGMDRDDIAQELRIVLVKAAKKFDEARGVSFHTYLHTAMMNTIRTLISQAQRVPNINSLDETFADSELVPLEIVEALSEDPDLDGSMLVDDLINQYNISDDERSFIMLRMDGMTMGEITVDLGESAYKIRQSLRDKLHGNSSETTFHL